MARKIGQIKQELAAIEETVAAVAETFRSIYEQYLNSLIQSTRKQLILASYQICTQVYPKSFLKLSLKQKEKLQENLRQLGQQIQPQFLACVEDRADSELNIMEQMLSQLPEESKNSQQSTTEAELLAQALTEIETNEDEGLEQESEAEESYINSPERWLHWHKQVEQEITKTLEKFSKEANYLLYQAQVLPNQLPAKIFDAALKAEESSSPASGPPNLLNLLVEAENERSQKAVAKITAICLRRAEIEFSEPSLSAQRHQIRKLVDKLSKIRQQYRQKQREYAVAEAEAAWRASWFEE